MDESEKTLFDVKCMIVGELIKTYSNHKKYKEGNGPMLAKEEVYRSAWLKLRTDEDIVKEAIHQLGHEEITISGTVSDIGGKSYEFVALHPYINPNSTMIKKYLFPKIINGERK